MRDCEQVRLQVLCLYMETKNLATLVKEFFEALGSTVEGVEVLKGGRTVVAVTSPDSKELIGENGDTLRAINHLLKRMAEVRCKGEELTFTVDVAGYLEKQLEGLRGNARMLAQRVRLFKHEVELPPMSSYERLVIHELFADDPEIKTESAGEGKFRHIVLKHTESIAHPTA